MSRDESKNVDSKHEALATNSGKHSISETIAEIGFTAAVHYVAEAVAGTAGAFTASLLHVSEFGNPEANMRMGPKTNLIPTDKKSGPNLFWERRETHPGTSTGSRFDPSSRFKR